MEPERLFPRPFGPHCASCALLDVCGAERSDNACSPRLDLGGRGGPFRLHPLRTDFGEHVARVGGVGFDDVLALATVAPSLRAYLPQVKWLARIRPERLTALDVPVVAIRVKEVFRGGRIRTADEVRAMCGLSADVDVVLLLHGKDELLERLAAAELAQIAMAQYALVTPPSFSLWEPQRRPDNLLSLRRSLLYYADLQAAGAVTCPRVGWVEERDVERLAGFVNQHSLPFVSLDLMTYDGPSFDRAVSCLAHFDELTGRSRRYLIDGVRAQRKIEDIYLALEPKRVTISSATLTAPPDELDGLINDTFMARALHFTDVCDAAASNVARAHSRTVDEFIGSTLAAAEHRPAVPRRSRRLTQARRR